MDGRPTAPGTARGPGLHGSHLLPAQARLLPGVPLLPLPRRRRRRARVGGGRARGSALAASFPSLWFEIYPLPVDAATGLISASVRAALEAPLNYARNYLADLLPKCVPPAEMEGSRGQVNDSQRRERGGKGRGRQNTGIDIDMEKVVIITYTERQTIKSAVISTWPHCTTPEYMGCL